jgi:hypothetical protein
MCAVPNMAVFCSSLISCCPGMLLRHCLSDFEMAPVAPIIYWYHFCFHIPNYYYYYYYYYYYCKTFARNDLFPKITGAVNNHIFSGYLLTHTPYLCLFLYLYFSLSHSHTHPYTHTHTYTHARAHELKPKSTKSTRRSDFSALGRDISGKSSSFVH